MPQNQQFDNGELQSMALGYDALRSDLDNEVRIVAGLNTCITSKGKLVKRPGTLSRGSTSNMGSNYRCDRMISYSTLDSPPKIFVVASLFNLTTSLWEAWYWSDTVSGWIQMGATRNANASTLPHEFLVSRGLCFIKGFPSNTGDKLGTITFNGTTLIVDIWGMVPPSSPIAMTASSGWIASTYPVSVLSGWKYVYTYKGIHGEESNRSPLQTDPSKPASNTGAFTNKCPAMQITVDSEHASLYYPKIVIYRTTDAGGSFYKVEEITNPGPSTFTYTDRNYFDGTATPSQPYPDGALDTTLISPTLTSNSPPPSVTSTFSNLTTITANMTSTQTTMVLASLALLPSLYPFTMQVDNEYVTATSLSSGTTVNVTRGVNGSVPVAHTSGAQVAYTPIVTIDPVQHSSPMASFAGRIWYFINNILFYSANEEITVGVQEDAWPSGLAGNFYRFDKQGVNLIATSEALYILTTDSVWWIRGYSKDTFTLLPLFTDVGARRNHPLSVATADKSIIWLTNDFRIAMARGPSRTFLSDQLGKAFYDEVVASGSSLSLTRHQREEKDWLLVTTFNPAASDIATVRACDFNQTADGTPIWNTPWSVRISAIMVGKSTSTVNAEEKINVATFASSLGAGLTYFDLNTSGSNSFSTISDYVWGVGTVDYAFNFQISPVRNPTGNHINALRLPGMVSNIYGIKIDRTSFSDRIASTYQSPSGIGQSLTCDVTFTDGNQHDVSLYILDWDYLKRAERIDVLDGATLSVLASVTVGSFTGGLYETFRVSGHVVFKITNLSGINSVMSAILFDNTLGVMPGNTAAYLGEDSTTQGNWPVTYGADGGAIATLSPIFPAYAGFSFTATEFLWQSATNDPRAPSRISANTILDTDPTVYVQLDSGINAPLYSPTYGSQELTQVYAPVGPPRRIQSSGYVTLWYELGAKACERATVIVQKGASSENFEIQKLSYIWSPDGAA